MKRRSYGLGARLAAAVLVFGALAASRASGADAEPGDDAVRLRSADRTGVSFEVVLGDPEITPLLGTVYHEIRFADFGNGGDEGAPSLPQRVVWIGIPEGVEARLSTTAYGLVFRDGVRPRPRVLLEGEGESGEEAPALQEILRPELSEQPAYRSRGGDDPGARLLGYSAIRSQRVVGIQLRPVRYDAAAQRLEWPERLEVRVEFSGFATSVDRPGAEPAFEPVYRDLILNYESAKAFRRRAGGPVSSGAGSGVRSTAQAGTDFTVASNWIRVRVRTKGIQRLSGADLSGAGVPVGSVASGDLRLFARPGLPILPEVGFCDTCDIREVAIRVDDGGDGRLDTQDQVLFFGLGASGWTDDYTGPDTTEASWIDHPYENDNFYWFTWNANLASPPRRWPTRDVAPVQPGATPAPHFPARLHLEENRVYEPNLYDPAYVIWDQWVWQTLTNTLGALVYRADTRAGVPTEPARIKARFWGINFASHYLQPEINGIPLELENWCCRNKLDIDTTGIFLNPDPLVFRQILQVEVPNAPTRTDQQAFLYWELHYRKRFEPFGDLLEFRSPGGISPSTPAEIVLDPVSPSATPSMVIVDHTDPFTPVELTGYAVEDSGNEKAVRWHETLGGMRHYFMAAANRFSRPRLEPVTVRDIRSPAMSADYVVITYDAFEPQAQTLANHRRTYLPGIPSPRASVIRISDIYAWYSGGRTDPTAVRNFLYDVTVNGRWNAPAPSYVCLLGDASYDFRNNFGFAPSGEPTTLVPTWVHGFYTRQFLSDDWIADIDIAPFDPSPGDTILTGNWQSLPDFFVGRLPASTVTEATTMIESKIIPYDAGHQFGEWRNRVLLVADDQFQGTSPDPLYGRHMKHSEDVDRAWVPSETDRAKVYLFEYPSEPGANKPAANRDILDQINDGALVWNYFGHGNPFQMADENAFRVGDVPSLHNLDRLTLTFAASCDLGKFDDPTKFGLGEALIKSPLGGAIATISASEIAFDSENFQLTNSFYSRLFSSPEQGYPLSLGQTLMLAKYRSDPDVNDRKFILMGDPATRLAHPERGVRLEVFDDETGAALTDSLPRGRRVRVEGEVHGSRDETVLELQVDFQGTASLWVTDSAPLLPYHEFPSTPQIFYAGNPSTVYRGDAQVENGRFSARFYVPMEARMGDLGRVRAYVRNADQDGVGFSARSIADGTPSEVDTVGPAIDLRFTSPTRYVAPDAELRVVLRDEHGINVSGNSAANSILLTIDESLRFDLTDDFRYDTNSYQQGSVLFRLPGLENGNHTIRVTATDNFALGVQGLQNRGEAAIDFTVSQATSDLGLQVLPFPSPFRPGEGTEVIVNGIAEASDLSLEVFTTAGRRVRSLSATGGPGSAQIRWDGADDFGTVVANGVYLLRVEVRPLSGGPSRVAEGRVSAFR